MKKNKTILEIGTWNGLGSTRCIVNGLLERKTPYTFYSLECNSEKVAMAQELYKGIAGVHILDEVLLNEMPSNIYSIFAELINNEEYRMWNKVDFDNMKHKPLFLERQDLPSIFDVVLLDGGEFTTWYEYQLIKDRCRILVLDDSHTSKCRRIMYEIMDQPDKWTIILNSSERRGTFACVRKGL